MTRTQRNALVGAATFVLIVIVLIFAARAWSWDLSAGDWSDIIAAALALVGLGFAWDQLRKAAQTTEVQVVLALDQNLAAFEDIRGALHTPDESAIDEQRLRRYLAAFERVGYALKSAQISEERVDRFYGSRFERLVGYCAARRIVRTDPDGWLDFRDLWESLYDYRDNKRGLPGPDDEITCTCGAC